MRLPQVHFVLLHAGRQHVQRPTELIVFGIWLRKAPWRPDVPLRLAPGSPFLPIVETREPAPRHVRHRALGAVIAGYLLVALLTVPVAESAPLHGWIALHLLLLGAATNAIFVFGRHFAQALLHTRAGSERWATVRLAVLNVGVVSVLVGVSLPAEPLLAVGGSLVVIAVLAHVVSSVCMQRSASMAGRLGVVVASTSSPVWH